MTTENMRAVWHLINNHVVLQDQYKAESFQEALITQRVRFSYQQYIHSVQKSKLPYQVCLKQITDCSMRESAWATKDQIKRSREVENLLTEIHNLNAQIPTVDHGIAALWFVWDHFPIYLDRQIPNRWIKDILSFIRQSRNIGFNAFGSLGGFASKMESGQVPEASYRHVIEAYESILDLKVERLQDLIPTPKLTSRISAKGVQCNQ